MKLLPIKKVILYSGKKQLQVALNTGMHPTRLNLILNGWISPNEKEKYLLAQEMGKSVGELFPEEARV